MKPNTKKPLQQRHFILVGPPYCGKGTQATQLCEQYGLVHLSTGNLLREAVAKNTEIGKLAKPYMEAAQNVPDPLVFDLVWEFLLEHQNCEGIVFDGYPRNTNQAEHLQQSLSNLAMDDVSVVFQFIGLTLEELQKRQKVRAETSGRPDDANPENVAKRYQEYEEETLPMMMFYEGINPMVAQYGDIIYHIHGMASPQEVTLKMQQHMTLLFSNRVTV